MEEAVVQYDDVISVETQFAKALEEYQLSLNTVHNNNNNNTTTINDDRIEDDSTSQALPQDFVRKFSEITAKRALDIKTENINDEDNSFVNEEFINWDLETKLWRLVENLYYSRVFEREDFANEYEKQRSDLLVILDWIQYNSTIDPIPNDDDDESIKLRNKWANTRVALETSKYNALTGDDEKVNLVEHLDSDAPLRNNKEIEPSDIDIDSKNFKIIYQLLLLGEIKSAIDYSKDTGNFTMALILAGEMDIRDQETDVSNFNKATWIKLVYNLSKNPNIGYYEKLIYNYLSGGDVSENLKLASNSYEEYLNVLISQLLSYGILKTSKSSGLKDLVVPEPQVKTLEEILNVISAATGTRASEESFHPIRVIAGSVMIEKSENIFADLTENTVDDILRIVTHLAIFLALIKPLEKPDQLNAVISLYVSKLSEKGQNDLIPIYLSFIPDEEDAREIYSIILSSITDKQERSKQLQIAKRITQTLGDSDDLVEIDRDQDLKLTNALRRTVERVIEETAPYYEQSGPVLVHDEDDIQNSEVDDIDFKLYSSVEWFYENKMYENAIKATIIVIRRFLVMGKLSSLKKFAEDKNFKNLISDYNFQSLSNEENMESVTEDMKNELLNYSNFIEALKLMSQWRQFSADKNPYNSSNIDLSLNKTSRVLTDILNDWLVEFSDPILKEFRVLYIPYIILELLTIYQNARSKDWKYIKMAFELINKVADDSQNDFLHCFKSSDRLQEFLKRIGELSIIASEGGLNTLYCL
ncbi:NUP84 [Candida pseudojiufengensis]|uniref:NUP84 n=1 Tax=Candida pseudojiufengensis TaxID=497109 RepID=UPI00222547AD|nr:NUP84 [Candida pseudojiufengensis]KAI5965598.1 NUP84 [Candida pseudojiufengensis]